MINHQQALDPNEKKSQSIRRTLILVLLGLQLVTIVLILFIIHISSERDMNAQISILLKNALSESKEHAQGFLEPSYRAVQISADIFSKKMINVNSVPELESYFISQLQANKEITSIYLATVRGDFYFITRNYETEKSGFMTKVIDHAKPGKASFYFRDENLNILEVHPDKDDQFRADSRPWYRKAIDKQNLVWTEPYVFYTSNQPGITIAAPFYNAEKQLLGVVGVDIELTSVSRFLADLKVYGSITVSMASKSGNFVATPSLGAEGLNLSSLKVAAADSDSFSVEKKAVSYFLKQSAASSDALSGEFLHGETSYAIRHEPFLLKDGPEWIISAYAPKSVFLSEIRSGELRNTLIAVTVLILSLLIGWILIRKTWQPFDHFFHDVVTDQLTGLFNRRFLENIGSRMYIRLLRDQHDVISVAVIDLDFFSKTNNEFGYNIGNHALVEFAEFLRKTLRPEDIITRYTGDTFVIIFPGLNNEQAMHVVDRMRANLDSWPLTVDDLLVRLSFSAGIETIDKHNCAENAAFSDFIDVARRAMDTAKQEGRDRVVSANLANYRVEPNPRAEKVV